MVPDRCPLYAIREVPSEHDQGEAGVTTESQLHSRGDEHPRQGDNKSKDSREGSPRDQKEVHAARPRWGPREGKSISHWEPCGSPGDTAIVFCMGLHRNSPEWTLEKAVNIGHLWEVEINNPMHMRDFSHVNCYLRCVWYVYHIHGFLN